MAFNLPTLLDSDGLSTLWGRISSLFVRKETGKGLSANDFTDTLKNKLDGIDEGANAYTHPEVLGEAKVEGLYKFSVDANGHISGVNQVGKSDITGLGIPAQDTTYDTMSGASASEDGEGGLVPTPVAGDVNRFLRADGTWVTPPNDNTTYEKATNSADGLMSKEDFAKLAGIEAQATRTIVDSAIDATSTNPVQNKVVKEYADGVGTSTLASAKSYTDQKVTSVYRYAGSVATQNDLPDPENLSEGQTLTAGDVYNIVAASDYGAAGMNVAWTGSGWDNLGGSFSVNALTAEQINAICV